MKAKFTSDKEVILTLMGFSLMAAIVTMHPIAWGIFMFNLLTFSIQIFIKFSNGSDIYNVSKKKSIYKTSIKKVKSYENEESTSSFESLKDIVNRLDHERMLLKNVNLESKQQVLKFIRSNKGCTVVFDVINEEFLMDRTFALEAIANEPSAFYSFFRKYFENDPEIMYLVLSEDSSRFNLGYDLMQDKVFNKVLYDDQIPYEKKYQEYRSLIEILQKKQKNRIMN